MTEPVKKPVHVGRTSRLKPRADTRTGETLDSEGADYARGVYAEDFRGAGDVSEAIEWDGPSEHW